METVNFLAFLEEKISVLLLHLFFLLFVMMTLMFSQTHEFYILLLLGIFVLCEGAVLAVTYIREKKEYDRSVALTDGLEEKYYIAEVLPKPRDIRGAAYYYALKEAGVPAWMHLYSQGGHGYGLRDRGAAVNEWPDRAEAWFRELGVIE